MSKYREQKNGMRKMAGDSTFNPLAPLPTIKTGDEEANKTTRSIVWAFAGIFLLVALVVGYFLYTKDNDK